MDGREKLGAQVCSRCAREVPVKGPPAGFSPINYLAGILGRLGQEKHAGNAHVPERVETLGMPVSDMQVLSEETAVRRTVAQQLHEGRRIYMRDVSLSTMRCV